MPLEGTPLRDYQAEGIDRLRDSLRSGHRRPMMQAPTGAGKTLVAANLVRMVQAKGKRVMFVVPALSLIDQSVEAFASEGIWEVGVIQANHISTNWALPVQVCSVQTLARRWPQAPEADLVIVDECFVRGTNIATPNGSRRIEEMREGDLVFNALGVSRVEGVVRKWRAATVTLRLSNGEIVRVTEDHPIFTGSGWKAAGELEIRSRLFSQEALRALWGGHAPLDKRDDRASHVGSGLGQAAFLREVLRQEAGQSDIAAWGGGEDGVHASGTQTQAGRARREWRAAFATPAGPVGCSRAGMGSGMGGSDESWPSERDLSESLQDRHCEPGIALWNRGGREFSCREEARYGSKENRSFGDIWVVDISRDEYARPEPVYNLRISGHPSYFAGGVLVHNCHIIFQHYGVWMTDPRWLKVPFVGLSATPWTKGLGVLYDDLITLTTTAELIAGGYLSPFRVFAPSHPDLKGVRTVAGDYVDAELSQAMNKDVLVADVVQTWLDRAEGRPTLCFGVDRAHAKHLQKQFEARGIPCGYQDMATDPLERRQIKIKFHSGEYRVVCNVDTLTVGVDWDVRCISLVRPTKSIMKFAQIIGRGLRTAEGKDDLLILDHSDNHLRLGFVTDISRDALDMGRQAVSTEHQVALPKECPQCHYLRPPRVSECPSCGFKPEPRRGPTQADGELVELHPGEPKTNKRVKPGGIQFGDRLIPKAEFYGELKSYAHVHGRKPGWAAHSYRDMTGTWPNAYKDASPMPVSAEVERWVRSRAIAWAKAHPRRA
jgi:DNA repair protein RadD